MFVSPYSLIFFLSHFLTAVDSVGLSAIRVDCVYGVILGVKTRVCQDRDPALTVICQGIWGLTWSLYHIPLKA